LFNLFILPFFIEKGGKVKNPHCMKTHQFPNQASSK
jgi:hypothetical protein